MRCMLLIALTFTASGCALFDDYEYDVVHVPMWQGHGYAHGPTCGCGHAAPPLPVATQAPPLGSAPALASAPAPAATAAPTIHTLTPGAIIPVSNPPPQSAEPALR